MRDEIDDQPTTEDRAGQEPIWQTSPVKDRSRLLFRFILIGVCLIAAGVALFIFLPALRYIIVDIILRSQKSVRYSFMSYSKNGIK